MNLKIILTVLALVTLSSLTLSVRIGPHTEKCGAPPSVTGMCRASIPAWTYKGGQCVSFTYGGCDKTLNYFNSHGYLDNQLMPSVEGHLLYSTK